MDRAGIAGEDGPTHHGALDIAYLKCIQDMIVTAPMNGNELRHLLYTGLDYHKGPFSIRYPKASSKHFNEYGQAELLPIGSWEVIRQGTDVVILAVGPQVYDALDSADQFSHSGTSCEVVNCRFIKPMDFAYLESIIDRFDQVITVEEGVRSGGFGEAVAAWLSVNEYKGKTKIISLPNEFVEHGPRQILLNKYGISTEGINMSVNSQKLPISMDG